VSGCHTRTVHGIRMVCWLGFFPARCKSIRIARTLSDMSDRLSRCCHLLVMQVTQYDGFTWIFDDDYYIVGYFIALIVTYMF
jgi:hypothetical protein